jgi:hypothetical protein
MTVSPAPVTSTAWSEPKMGMWRGGRRGSNRAIPSRPRVISNAFKSLAVEKFPPERVKPVQIVANRLAKRGLHFRFVGCCRGEVLVTRKIVAGIDGDRQDPPAGAFSKRIDFLGVGRAVSVIGNQHTRGRSEQPRRRLRQSCSQFRIQGFSGFPVDAHNLLALPVRESSQDSHLGGSQVAGQADDVPGGNLPFAKVSEQAIARLSSSLQLPPA